MSFLLDMSSGMIISSKEDMIIAGEEKGESLYGKDFWVSNNWYTGSDFDNHDSHDADSSQVKRRFYEAVYVLG